MKNSAVNRVFSTALELRDHLEQVRSGKCVVMTNGCFDIVHVGHLRSLEEARTYGDLLIVGINSDNSVRRLKGANRPIIPQAERAEIVAGLHPVDYCFIFDEATAVEGLAIINPHVYVKSSDYEISETPEGKLALETGKAIYQLSYYKGRSTSEIVRKIRTTFV